MTAPFIPAHSRPKDGVLPHAYAGIQSPEVGLSMPWIPIASRL
jgi:hypothetical protein